MRLMLRMKRPSDQAKLLFVALLRTVSALATTDSKGAAGVALKSCAPPAATSPASAHIQLRLARRTDISSIQQCNLATLPENYNNQFYNSHLRQWPDLALVAEYVTAAPPKTKAPLSAPASSSSSSSSSLPSSSSTTSSMEDFRQGKSISKSVKSHILSSSFPLSNSIGNNNRGEPNVVAYVLGKVQEEPPQYDHYRPNNFYEENPQPSLLGHVTSLAVLPDFRRNGLANALMSQLHFHLQQCYSVDSVGLHVRRTNTAACSLYRNFGYEVDRIIHGYYQDGEDAYFMKKNFEEEEPAAGASCTSMPKFAFLGRRPRPWDNAPSPDLRLPRQIDIVTQAKKEEVGMEGRTIATASSSTTMDDETPELLTGTM